MLDPAGNLNRAGYSRLVLLRYDPLCRLLLLRWPAHFAVLVWMSVLLMPMRMLFSMCVLLLMLLLLVRMRLVMVMVVLRHDVHLTGMRAVMAVLMPLRVSLCDRHGRSAIGRLVRVVEHLAEEQVQGRRCPSAWIGP